MKKLYRSRRSKMIGGVAAGLAEYLSIDVTLMRLLFVLLGLALPNFVLAYLIAWLIIPEEPRQSDSGQTPGHGGTEPASCQPHSGSQGSGPASGGSLPPTANEILAASGKLPAEAGGDGTCAAEPSSCTGESTPGRQPPAPSSTVGPEGAQPERSTRSDGDHAADRNKQFFGYALVIVGALALLQRWIPGLILGFPIRMIRTWWPALLILAGLAVVVGAIRGGSQK